MQIVIDIDEKVYNDFKDAYKRGYCGRMIDLDIIINGTILPKGHGRLIDADKLWDSYHDLDYDFYEAFDLADTIIEADKDE